MTRNMIEANKDLFRRLVEYCQDREWPIDNPDAARWVHLDGDAKEVLKHLKIESVLSFGRYQHLTRVRVRNRSYIATIGYEHEFLSSGLLQLEDTQGFDVCLLSELKVEPVVDAASVFNVVSAGSREEGGEDYAGHDLISIAHLFPVLRVYESTSELSEETARCIFLKMCVEECQLGGSWVNQQLADSLETLADLNVPSLPYHELCRAVFDRDPRSLYMALYRCIEATYAFDKASALVSKLDLKMEWTELAAVLQDNLNWRAPEAQSLNVALSRAQNRDLLDLCSCLGVEEGSDVRSTAGTAIYKLRNQIVHYRPTSQPLRFESIDWNRVCTLLVAISMDVFHGAYS